LKRPTNGEPPIRSRHAAGDHEPLIAGQRVRNNRTDLEGVVLDFACQYAHPKADPVYSYLVRMDDGQVLAITQAALTRDGGYEVLD